MLEKRKRILEKPLEIGDSDEIVLVSERVAQEKRKEEHRKNTIHHRNWLTGEVQTVGQHEEIKQLRKNHDDRAKELRSKARTEITELTKEIKKKRQRLEDDLRNLFDQHDKDSRRIETRKRVKKSKKVKGARTAYTFYLQEQHRLLKEEYPNFAERVRYIVRKWNELKEPERTPYEKQEADDKIRFARESLLE